MLEDTTDGLGKYVFEYFITIFTRLMLFLAERDYFPMFIFMLLRVAFRCAENSELHSLFTYVLKVASLM